MPMDERRRLAEEAKKIIAETRCEAENLKECVAQSRIRLEESRLLLAQTMSAVAYLRTSKESGDD